MKPIAEQSFIFCADTPIGYVQKHVLLSPLDDCLHSSYVTTLFFYEHALDSTSLKESLQKTLTKLPLFSGRLKHSGVNTEPSYVSVCNLGALFITTTFSTNYTDYGKHSSAHKLDHLKVFDPPNSFALNKDVPLVIVQLTQLRQGSVLCIKVNHAIVDGQAYFDFCKLWSNIHNNRSNGVINDNLDHLTNREFMRSIPVLSCANDTPVIQGNLSLVQLHLSTKGCRSVHYHFTRDELRIMKDRATSGLPTGLWVTTNNALAAHIWKVVAWLTNAAPQEFSKLVVLSNVRHALDLPSNYLGNALSLQSTECEYDELTSSNLSLNSYRVRCVYSNITKQIALETLGKVRDAKEKGISPRLLGSAVAGATLLYNDWSRFPAYEIEFGTGQPCWVEENMPMVKGLVMSIATPDGGRDVRICIPKQQQKMLQTPEWQAVLHCYAEDKEFPAVRPVASYCGAPGASGWFSRW